MSMYGAGWFALLSAIVPESLRGRFFGRLRTSWQLVGLVFTGLCIILLEEDSPLWAYQVVLGLATVGLALRVPFYLRLPELERGPSNPIDVASFVRVLLEVLRTDRYLPFCAYVFLLHLFTMGCPYLFGLVQKQTLGFGDDVVVSMGLVMMIGSLAGFALGGKAVDRWGTRPIFVMCHFGFGVILLAFLCRGLFPGPVVVAVAGAQFLFGLVQAASSIALTTEMLALIPPENKALSTSVCMLMWMGGAGLSGIVAAAILDLGVLRQHWELCGTPLGPYDAILLAYGAMVVLLVVTLGLVPSVIGKAQWIPQSR